MKRSEWPNDHFNSTHLELCNKEWMPERIKFRLRATRLCKNKLKRPRSLNKERGRSKDMSEGEMNYSQLMESIILHITTRLRRRSFSFPLTEQRGWQMQSLSGAEINAQRIFSVAEEAEEWGTCIRKKKKKRKRLKLSFKLDIFLLFVSFISTTLPHLCFYSHLCDSCPPSDFSQVQTKKINTMLQHACHCLIALPCIFTYCLI